MADVQSGLADAQMVVARWRADACLGGPGASPLQTAMGYALSGGKALRAFLVLESCRLHGVDRAASERAAFAIECIHAYSLVHDDLPAMDNDDLRRGQPTVHRKWDEATAILTGDALQTLAFDLIAHPEMGPERAEAIKLLARAAMAMVRGQMADIAAETAETPLSLDEITALQRDKTGALITWSATVGPVLAGQHSSGLRDYAQALGLAFQIADDILDVEGDAAEVGKAVGKDAAAGKATFVSHLGLDGAKHRAAALVQTAQDALHTYGDAGDALRDLARFVIDRKK